MGVLVAAVSWKLPTKEEEKSELRLARVKTQGSVMLIVAWSNSCQHIMRAPKGQLGRQLWPRRKVLCPVPSALVGSGRRRPAPSSSLKSLLSPQVPITLTDLRGWEKQGRRRS